VSKPLVGGLAALIREDAERKKQEAQSPPSTGSPPTQGNPIEGGLPIQGKPSVGSLPNDGAPTESSPPKSEPLGYPKGSPTPESGPPTQSNPTPQAADLWAAVALKKGYSKLYHSIVDDVFPQLTADEQAVYTHLYRLSWGFNNPGVIVSLPKLAERAGMSRNSAARAIARLVGRGLVIKGEPFFGKNQEQGREYRLPIPSSLTSGGSLPAEGSPPSMGRNKERLKETVKKSGVASLPEEEKASCPDCHGQGYYYPGGFNEGVKICRHENLRRAGK
jgi:hypothetical protein